LDLAAALVSAPDGMLDPYAGPTPDSVQEAATRLSFHVTEETLDADLAEVHHVLHAAETLPPTLAANDCLAMLATRLTGAPGAGFLGFAAESLRVHRALLKRTNRRADPMHWSFYARGALLARAQLTRPGDLPALAAACEQILATSLLSEQDREAYALEQAILWHAAAEILVRAAAAAIGTRSDALYERAATACSHSLRAARGLGTAYQSFAYIALECRARVERGLGSDAQERSTLMAALPLAPTAQRAGIQARMSELTSTVPTARPHWADAVEARLRKRVTDARNQTDDRLIHASPLRRHVGDAQILVLRPLVTALAPTVPNRFTAPMRHAWRFDDEPPAMTFEETLSRALGHRFSFAAVGAEWEALGVGRVETIDWDGSEVSDAWKRKVDLMTRDPILARIILIYPSDSPGMQWELDLLASTRGVDQARFFLIPPHVDAEAGHATWHRARRALAARHLDIPAWTTDGLVFRHDSRNAVAMCDTFQAVWDGRFAGWLQAHAEAAPD
jgi:hypothetical protein